MSRPIRSILIRPIAWPVLQVRLEPVGEDPCLPGVAVNAGDRLQIRGGRELRLELVELVRRLACLIDAVGGRERLLPDQRQPDVGEDDEPGGDQHDRDDAERRGARPVILAAAPNEPRHTSRAQWTKVMRGARGESDEQRSPRIASYQADPAEGRPRPAALFGRPRHLGDAAVDPGALRGRDRHPHRQSRPARRGLGRRHRQGGAARRGRGDAWSTPARSSRATTCCRRSRRTPSTAAAIRSSPRSGAR